MSKKAAVCFVTAISFLSQMSFASGGASVGFVASMPCQKIVAGDPEDKALLTQIDIVANTVKMQVDQKAREEAIGGLDELGKYDAKIKDLRDLNGVWETRRITDKRLVAMTFESFIMVNEIGLINAHFSGPFSATEYSAMKYIITEAYLNSLYKKMADGRVVQDAVTDIILKEQDRLEEAKKAFLASADDTMSLKFILELMKNEGIIIDVNTLFGAAAHTLDIKGQEIPLPRQAEENSLNDQEGLVAPRTMAAQPLLNNQGSDIDVNVLKARALLVDQKIGEFMNLDDTKKLIQLAKETIGADYIVSRPTFQELSALRKRLVGSSTSTEVLLAKKQKQLSDERRLRLALLFKGPQLVEVLNSWLGLVPKALNVVVKPLARLVGLEYDGAVRRRHLANILKVLAVQNPDTQIDKLLEGSANGDTDDNAEFIVTFIRFVPARGAWQKIMDRLQVLADGTPAVSAVEAAPAAGDKAAVPGSPAKAAQGKSSYYGKLLKQFQTYEDKAIALRPLPVIGPRPDVRGRLVTFGAGAAAVVWGPEAWSYAYAHVAELFSSANMAALMEMFHKLVHLI